MGDTYATCAVCGSRVPLSLIAAHVAEHDLRLSAADIADAPVVEACEACGGVFDHMVGCPEADRPR